MTSVLKGEIRIAAVSVNHNTSAYMELMLRSFFAMHTPQFDCSFTLYDNQSNDEGLASLLEYVNAKQMPLIQSGFNLETKYNSHG
jgi:hypothetical protein